MHKELNILGRVVIYSAAVIVGLIAIAFIIGLCIGIVRLVK